MDGNLRGIGLTGLLGGPGQLVLDPNDISYEDFRGLYSTFGGFSRLPVEIRREIISDPLQRDRQLYQIISSNPQNTNRCYLVTCPTEAGRHKMLLYQGHKLMIIVPMVSRKSKEDNSATPRRQAPPDATTAMRNSCRANLRQLEGAKEIWALENHKKIGDLITLQDLVPHYIKAAPVCPAGGQYALNVLGQEPACTVPGHRYNE
jgi:hypothetical protein